MGLAKTMNALGEYDFYSPDYKLFATSVGHFLNINVKVSFSDYLSHDNSLAIEDEFFDFGYPITYKLTVSNEGIDEGKPSYGSLYLVYELKIPVEFEFGKELVLEFLPNAIFQLRYIPFSTAWKFFIEDMVGYNDSYYNSHDDIFRKIIEIRNFYKDILTKIKCTQVVIWTDAGYQTEVEFTSDMKLHQKNSLQEVIEALKALDHVKIYDLLEVLKQKTVVNSKHHDYLDVAFIDNLTDLD